LHSKAHDIFHHLHNHILVVCSARYHACTMRTKPCVGEFCLTETCLINVSALYFTPYCRSHCWSLLGVSTMSGVGLTR
jgi:hypothetical protein